MYVYAIAGGGYYTLRDVVFFLQNIEAPEAEYRRKCLQSQITAVVLQGII